ncbi:MAG: regulatory iron-sulfur-containing complex subunit RicT [Flavobacteriales bacterium]
MACRNCGSGGCGTTPAGCKNNGNCGTSGCNKLDVFDWLAGMNTAVAADQQFVEVRFKNTRKEFYRNSDRVEAHVGETVTVEGVTGIDVGVVSLTGELVRFQMKKYKIKPDHKDIRKVLRKSSEEDIKQWQEAQERERETLVKTRKIIRELKLDMKLSDVEYQSDQSRATFYYTAEDRVDFRELIKVLADQFRIRVEMKQIGARQEAGMVGGIGSCGRELCCSTWLTDFRTVSTNAARYQQLSINPMKLAGQCGKLKCCLNYELDSYMDALKDFPDNKVKLKTKKGIAFHQKSDIFRGMMWYSYKDSPNEFIPLKIDRVKEVIAINEKGKEVDDLKGFSYEEAVAVVEPTFENVVGQDDLTRFDRKAGEGKRKKKSKNRNKNRNRDQRNEKKE